MIALILHEDAKSDLLALRDTKPKAAGRIIALLQQLEGDPDLLDRLTQHDYGAYGSADFHVDRWESEWRKGKDLWRLKLWDLEDKGLLYRIVYAFIPKTQRYHVLAIAPREFNYDANHPIGQRILRAYKEL